MLKRSGFRFLFLYLVLYCLPLPPIWTWDLFIGDIGRLLGVDARFRMNGSGDTTFHYVQLLCILTISLAGALVWSLLDRRRGNYRRLYLALRIVVRLYLGATLLQYGAAKVIPMQFPSPSLHRLHETFGEASPMGLLWTFMGVSRPYNAITGSVEMLAGVLLFFPRTTLLGALLSIVVMVQICALNFCYDVPVKIYSSHLLAMGLFLAAEDAHRLAGFFVFNRAVPSAQEERILQRKGWRQAVLVLKCAFLATILVNAFRRPAPIYSDADPSQFLLLNRGFHWVNEAPFNR